MKKIASAALCGMLLANFAHATGEDLDRCVFKNGVAIDPRVCASLQKAAQRDTAAKARQTEFDEQRRLAREKHQVEQQVVLERQQAEQQARRDKDIADQNERSVALEKDRVISDRREALQAKTANDRESAIKTECGADYKKLIIGMSIQRAQKCVANLRMTGQLNRADGIVSTYEAGRVYAHVMDGRIVSWGK